MRLPNGYGTCYRLPESCHKLKVHSDAPYPPITHHMLLEFLKGQTLVVRQGRQLLVIRTEWYMVFR